MKCWEIIADNLSKAGWSWGYISSTDEEGRQFCVAAAERDDAGRFIVRADELLTAFVELESSVQNWWCRAVRVKRNPTHRSGTIPYRQTFLIR